LGLQACLNDAIPAEDRFVHVECAGTYLKATGASDCNALDEFNTAELGEETTTMTTQTSRTTVTTITTVTTTFASPTPAPVALAVRSEALRPCTAGWLGWVLGGALLALGL